VTKNSVKIWIGANAAIGVWMCHNASINYIGQSYGWMAFDLFIASLNFNASYVNYIMIKDKENE